MINFNIQKTYNSKKRSFYINTKGSFKLNAINVIYGESGAGKTSLLRLLSGLDTLDNGSIYIGEICWVDTHQKKTIPINKREIAYVFQDYSLFPNMTVLQNLYFAKKEVNKQLLESVLKTFEIDSFLYQKPTELSGGQQQRVALARAILQEPQFLFLDEPLTAIDENLKNKLQNYLIDLQKEHQFTIVMVSHNLQEILKVANHVCVVNNGKVIKQGVPEVLLSKNKENTLKGTVIYINKNNITVVVGTQQIIILQEKIISKTISIGSDVEFLV